MTEHNGMMRTLYLCYFGLREPLVQAQVLPYMRQLSEAGIDVTLLTFEPNKRRSWSEQDVKECRDQLQADGIRWFSLGYHKRPSLPATLYDIAVGAWTAARLVRSYKVDVLHARAHVPMAMAILAQRWTDCKLVFDIRGLMAEEYVDAGVWAEGGLKYRAMKRLERMGVLRANQVVVLTNRMRAWLIENKLANEDKVEVIPCCVEGSRFFLEDQASDDGPASTRFEVVYAGSVTGLYLLDEMARFFLEIRKRQPDAFFRILTQGSSRSVTDILSRAGLDQSDFSINSIPPDQVPKWLRKARLALSFRKPAFSQIAASPTKIPEYLAAGLGVVCGPGIGDMDSLLEQSGVGIIVRTFNSGAYADAAEKALSLANDPELQERCSRVVDKYFDLEGIGFAGYRQVYDRIRDHARSSTEEFIAS